MSSKRRLRRKACTGKVRHADAVGAQAQIRQIRRANPGTPYLNVYRCAFCSGFHVGHAKGTGPRPS
jgi:hypothetical protein